ncbi:zinc-ribbon domain-containing protein [Pseudobutyrivibrio sp. ACV-2]|uniref:chitobiase/beta-hexosaminidase C-terminal domain-containing protein n=1 Tax=Pseudobutyrivibrio sp. ACV-2 TaxID=1520801 RepID=UPI00089A1066|nr:chitobiase/beta-hexosaminidase C-terminal domain-containing protein [Pseudobutyrivibrio sp. ACV-2]SDZ82713.1 zinc-ribbon domain-containing protein [Pseudobutyrivibrio sp. ACV-2]
MKCKNCGAEIESGYVYCPSCGESIQLVPNYNVLEEELLFKVVEDKDKQKDDRFATGVYKPVAKPQTTTKNDKNHVTCDSNPIIRNKDFLKKIVAFLIIVIFGMMVIIPYFGSHSYDTLMNKAVEAEANEQYAKALGFYEDAYDIDNSSFEVIYGLGRMYYQVKEYDKAEEFLSLALEIEPKNKNIYSALIECYKKLDDSESIRALYESAPNDDIAALFNDIVTVAPEFSEPGGEYEDMVMLELSVSNDNQIFYTTNGKNPTTSGKLFTKPIKLTEGTTEVKAVALNSKGEYSDVVSEVYTIKAVTLSMPIVTPEPATFNEQVSISIAVPMGCEAYYSWDGTNPVDGGIRYTDPFPVLNGASVLTVVIKDSKGNVSPLFRGEYIYTP